MGSGPRPLQASRGAHGRCPDRDRPPAGPGRPRGGDRGRDDGGDGPDLADRPGRPGGRQARRHGEQGPARRARARGLRPGGRAGRAVVFEGSVAGGIPIVHALGVSLAANQVQGLAAILNGTCNFILTSMTHGGLSYGAALRQAQDLGYAEADPTLDVDGTDTATSWPSWPSSPSAPASRRRRSLARGSTACTWPTSPTRPSWGIPSSSSPWPSCRSPAWSCGSRRPWSSTGPPWPRSAARTTPSGSSAMRWAMPSSRAEARGRCRPPRPSSAT